MSRRKRDPSRWRVRRTFEPNRLSSNHLEAAYAQIVPIQMRILRKKTTTISMSKLPAHEVCQERRTG